MISTARIETAPDAAFDGTTYSHENEQILLEISGL